MPSRLCWGKSRLKLNQELRLCSSIHQSGFILFVGITAVINWWFASLFCPSSGVFYNTCIELLWVSNWNSLSILKFIWCFLLLAALQHYRFRGCAIPKFHIFKLHIVVLFFIFVIPFTFTEISMKEFPELESY